VLCDLNILTPQEIQLIKSIKFNPTRVGFKLDTSPNAKPNGHELYTTDILNLGIRPDILLDIVRKKFLDQGGILYEQKSLDQIDIYRDRAILFLNGEQNITIDSRLVVDCTGNGSPITKQIRGITRPDGICIVVGSCASGFKSENNTYSDVIYTDSPISSLPIQPGQTRASQTQYFWEAFPTGSGPTDRTTYLFTYMEAEPERPCVSDVY
jgi:hypothetical protein